MTQIVECIPNFSTAQTEILDQIVAAVKSIPGVQLLDRSSDIDHNRSVLTFIGSPQDVEEAAFRAIRKAAELIDMNRHSGAHPRIGATDVVPFVPLQNTTLDDCSQIARRLGKRVGAVLSIPVYLYANAALHPERERLENVRRGQYEGLKTAIGSDATHAPDFGPARLGSAGATAIGARGPLIAFNVYLTSDNLQIAKKIARSVRQSSGGLPHVKALGLLVGGRGQVSMNLTDFRTTSIHLAVEAVRAEAQQAGVDIHHSELIGLIPQAALLDAAAESLQIQGFHPGLVLETHLASLPTQPTPDRPASAPTDHHPLNSNVAAVQAARQAAALITTVVGQTLSKKKPAEIESEMKTICARVETLSNELAQDADEDTRAHQATLAAFKLPAGDPAKETTRSTAIEQATVRALEVPASVARKAVEIMSLAERCVQVGDLNAIGEAAAAVSLARAALFAAEYNLRINADGLQKKANGEAFIFEIDALTVRAARINRQARHTLRERAGIKLE